MERERVGSLLQLVVAWAIALIIIWTFATIYGQRGGAQPAVPSPQSPVDVLSSWDGKHYRALAEHGYSISATEQRRLNLFPLFPALSYLIGGRQHAALAGILLNQLLLLGSMLLLTTLARDGPAAPLRQQPGFWLLISPFGFFLSAMYAESLFLFLSLLFFLAACRRYHGIAFAAGLLAGLTRPMAIALPLLLISPLLVAIRRRENPLCLFAVAAAPLMGICIFVGAVGFALGSPLGYLQIHSSWGNEWTIPFLPMWDALRWSYINSVSIGEIEPVEVPAAVAQTALIIVLLALYGWRKPVAAFMPYLIFSMLVIEGEVPFRGTPRYELVLFPVFLMAANSFLTKRWFAPIVATVSIVAQFYFLLRFSQWQWVA